MEVSEAGLPYTSTIRDDLKWIDGSPVTAENYVYTVKNLMFSDRLNSTYQSDWQETVDDETVFMQLTDQATFTIKRQTVNQEFVDNSIYSLTPYPKNHNVGRNCFFEP
jgi:peptide/nickel transport system substrate-binding protein